MYQNEIQFNPDYIPETDHKWPESEINKERSKNKVTDLFRKDDGNKMDRVECLFYELVIIYMHTST